MFLSMSIQVFICLGFIFQTIAQGNYSNYKNYRVYDVTPKSSSQTDFVKTLCETEYECFNEVIAIGSTLQIMVKPEKEAEFHVFNLTNDMRATVNIPNMQLFIEAQMKPMEEVLETASLINFTWDRYHSVEKIYTWLDLLENEYPEVSTINIGTTHEGRYIKGVTIDFREGLRKHDYYGMIEGGIHAREWISPATVTWIIKEFLTSRDPGIRFLAEAFVWHIFPVVNPDGYAYSFSHDRMWKNNRNIYDSFCPGVDLNRNFDWQWLGINETNNISCHNYPGPSAASEPETIAITRHVSALRKGGTLLYYFSFHSYSQLILFPYSHGNKRVKNYLHLRQMVKNGAEKMEALHGNTYKFGSANELHYDVSGSSLDWVRAKAKVPIVILFELRDNGLFGFLLPPSQIIPNNEEVMAALVEIDKVTRDLHYYLVINFNKKSIKRIGNKTASSLTAMAPYVYLLSCCCIAFCVYSPL